MVQFLMNSPDLFPPKRISHIYNISINMNLIDIYWGCSSMAFSDLSALLLYITGMHAQRSSHSSSLTHNMAEFSKAPVTCNSNAKDGTKPVTTLEELEQLDNVSFE